MVKSIEGKPHMYRSKTVKSNKTARRPTTLATSDGTNTASIWKRGFRTAKHNNPVKENPAVSNAIPKIPRPAVEICAERSFSETAGRIKYLDLYRQHHSLLIIHIPL
jgi:hypothetical protein